MKIQNLLTKRCLKIFTRDGSNAQSTYHIIKHWCFEAEGIFGKTCAVRLVFTIKTEFFINFLFFFHFLF